MDEKEVWYFAYGSNINKDQMMKRVGEWITSEIAIIKGYKLVFNVNSTRWGGLAANLCETGNSNDQVYGVLYLIQKQQLDEMTKYEGVPPQDIKIVYDGINVPAKTYIFNTNRQAGSPPIPYLETILTGYKQHGFSEELIDKLQKTYSVL